MKVKSATILALLGMTAATSAAPVVSPKKLLRQYVGVAEVIENVNSMAAQVERIGSIVTDLSLKYEEAMKLFKSVKMPRIKF